MSSLSKQTDPDYEQVVLVDNQGRGIGWANEQLQYIAPRGRYVLILDDDDMLTNDDAIGKLKAAALGRPSLVIFKADHAEHGILPHDSVWGERPIQGRIGSCDFITRRDVWQRHIAEFAVESCGDFAFLNSIWREDPQVYWLNQVLATVQRISHGEPEYA